LAPSEPPEPAERGAAGCVVPSAHTSATVLQCCPVALLGWTTQKQVEDINTYGLGVFYAAHVREEPWMFRE